MVCSNCGNTLKENEKFCTLCGTYNDPSNSLESDVKPKKKKKKEREQAKEEFFDDIGPIEDYVEEPAQFGEPERFGEPDLDAEIFEDVDLEEEPKPKKRKKDNLIVEEYNPKDDPDVVAYIGEDYKWIAERPFNIYALLLSWIYFLYRKLYLIGIIGLVITGIIYKYVQVILIPYIIISMVGSGIFFNKIYLDIIEDRVGRIQNKLKEDEDMEAICKKKGGVTVIVPLVVFTIFLVIMLSSYINFNMGEEPKEPNYWEGTSENLANCKEICRKYYNQSQSSSEVMTEFGCEVVSNTDGGKIYNIYIRSTKDGNTRYVLYEYDPDGYVQQKGDTELLTELEQREKEKSLTEKDKEILEVTRDLPNGLSYVRTTAENEDNMIKRYENTSPKTHFYFTKDDLFK